MAEHEKMNLAANAAENVETVTTEEITGQEEQIEQIEQQSEVLAVKTYTQEEVDHLMGERVAREKAKNAREIEKVRKEYEKKYLPLEDVLKAGTGEADVEKITEAFRDHYQSKGVKIPDRPAFNENDIATLAKADAAEIISLGLDEVVEEVDRLAKVGVKNMTPREKATFETLANYRAETERSRELEKIGAAEVAKTQEFKDFASKFSPNTPITEIYEIYNKMQPKKEVTTMGSMKTPPVENGVKDFYTYEESMKYTKKDFDDNPALYEAVLKSMRLWGKK